MLISDFSTSVIELEINFYCNEFSQWYVNPSTNKRSAITKNGIELILEILNETILGDIKEAIAEDTKQ